MANRAKKRKAKHSSLPSTRYLFFGGKGGVGKTTLACATAFYLLDEAQDRDRILLFSTDPAHSLSDSLGSAVGDKVMEVAGGRNESRLLACEMDAAAAVAEFKARHQRVLEEIADRGTFLDPSEIRELLNLSLPGMDEVMALFRLSELDAEGQYARIIVDTAPSGHTGRLLQLPAVMAGWTGTLSRLVEKHRYMGRHFGRGRGTPETELDRFLCDLADRVRRLQSILHDQNTSSFLLVVTPERMSGAESKRYRTFLCAEGVRVTNLIINRVEEEHEDCPYCRQRVIEQKAELQALTREFADLRQIRVPSLNREIQGEQALRSVGRFLWGNASVPAIVIKHAKGTVAPALCAGRTLFGASAAHRADAAASFAVSSSSLWIFGGKGGVGKTTAAAAAALVLARQNRKQRVLVLSIDPAHSLSDSFEEEIGSQTKTRLAGEPNLDGLEIDPEARFEEFKKNYRDWADRMFDAAEKESGWRIQFDRQAMRELFELAPPGIDEIVALSAISDFLDSSRYAAIVLDTAPTGHLIRFLELPEIALEWVHVLMRLLLKYKEIVEKEQIAGTLISLSKDIKKVISVLTDSARCRFVAVTTAERMSLEETIRLMRALTKLSVPLSHLLINKLVPESAASKCHFCAVRRSSQEETLLSLHDEWESAGQCVIAAQMTEEVRGSRRLTRFFRGWQVMTDVRE